MSRGQVGLPLACYLVTSAATEAGLAILAASKAMMSNVPVGLPSRER
jgi:hypothetical protein